MAINRSAWMNSFTVENLPVWPCPICKRGTLVPEKKINIIENVASKRERREQEWDPEWIQGVFGGTLKCSNTRCEEKVLLIGDMGVEQGYEYDEDGEPFGGYHEYLSPAMFVPAIHIFSVHEEVPRQIKNAIIESFKVYWADGSACANKIRSVLELLMDFFKVGKTYIHQNKRKTYTLHKRIELFKTQKNYEAEHLMAIKWIGNSGSHGSETIKKEDLLDAYEILDHVLIKLFEKDSQRLKQLSKQINKRKKPNSKKIVRRTKRAPRGLH